MNTLLQRIYGVLQILNCQYLISWWKDGCLVPSQKDHDPLYVRKRVLACQYITNAADAIYLVPRDTYDV